LLRKADFPVFTERNGESYHESLSSKRLMRDINFFAETDARGRRQLFGIRGPDRRLHMYCIGRTGMGKTSLLLNMILNDIYAEQGVCFLDPHGDAVESLLDYIPSFRAEDVIYLNPADTEFPIPLNMLSDVGRENRHLLISGILSVFQRLYPEHWQHRQEHILRNCLLTLFEHPGKKTLWEAYRQLTDWRYRKEVAKQVKDPVVRSFWQNEFSKYVYQNQGQALSPLLNKMGAFLTTPLVRNMVVVPGVAPGHQAVSCRAVQDRDPGKKAAGLLPVR